MDSKTKEFHCAGCGACCRWEGIVRLDDAQITALAEFMGVPEAEFIESFTRLAPDRRGLVLADAPDGACCFLTADNRCRVHPVKPRKCREFPLTWDVPPELMSKCQGHFVNPEKPCSS